MLLQVLLTAPVLLGAAHPDSLSFSRVEVDGADVRLVLRCQVLSLLEVVDADANGDGILENRELDLRREDVHAYFAEHYRISTAGAPLAGTLAKLERVDPEPAMPVFGSAADEWVHVEVSYAHEEKLETISLDVAMFLDTSPDHGDLCVLDWNGTAVSAPRFDAGTTSWKYDPFEGVPQRGILDWIEMGGEHILTGWDHLAFLLALIVAARRVRGVLFVVTAFTVAHSITLGLTALEIVPRLPDRVVELTIALSISYVAVENILRRKAHDPWVAAFFFGLIHGLGFAGFLSESLFLTRDKTLALLGFNLGVELGQLSIAALALALLWKFRDREDGNPESGLAPVRVRNVVSAIVAVLGAFWFVERAWF